MYPYSLLKRTVLACRVVCCLFQSCSALRCQVFPLCPLTPSITSTRRAQSQHRQPFEWPNAASCISLIRGHPHGWKPLKPLSPLSSMISELHPCTGECDGHIDFFSPSLKTLVYRSFSENEDGVMCVGEHPLHFHILAAQKYSICPLPFSLFISSSAFCFLIFL